MITNSHPALDTEVARVLSVAEGFDTSDIRTRYRRDHEGSEERALLIERECKRFLVLYALNPHKRLGMKGPVDEYWHTFILFTREYARFCDAVAGTFIHHAPNVGKDASADGSSYLAMLATYRSTFLEEPPSEVWPMSPANLTTNANCASGPGPSDCSPTSSCHGGGENCNAPD